ncbi:hypothetical protein TEA_017168 [Camellia sinensis var. sinensis]|uniref:TOG domain-containing protein n=1 Tax=Camellia sinensis var. sinensis TaxID=542762 RepID=A0A4S4EPK5_CAMSN|nr:hypothetical protein TEA_017168 [Camellia sinensis var. sinensis]
MVGGLVSYGFLAAFEGFPCSMAETALRDLNTLPISERKNEGSSKGGFTKPHSEHGLDERNKKNTALLVETPINGDESLISGAEVVNTEVEYIESENLNDVEDVDMSLKTLLAGLDSKDWVLVCEALNDNVIPLIVKSLKNPRSAVCKTSIMTSADIFSVYGDHITDSLDPLLVQLLLKSSQDKRFVCEAAERALIAMTTWVSPILLLPKLHPNLKNRNPRIRAKASMCFCRSVLGLGVEGIKAYGIDKLIQIAASQLSDQLPESREAARILLLELQTVYEKCHVPTQTAESEDSETGSWEHFCQSKLSPLSAQAVLRVTNIAREGRVLGS